MRQDHSTVAASGHTTGAARPSRARATLRIVVAIEAVAILLQAVTAGQILSGNSVFRAVHSAGAMLVFVLAIVQLVLAIVVWRRGSAHMIRPSVGVLVVVVVQAFAGVMHLRQLHIPLGVLMFGGMLHLAGHVWPGRGSATAARA